MVRRAHLTIIEAGAGLPARPREDARVDDWVVVVQQADEARAEFARRVSERAQRLAREGAGICAFEVVTRDDGGLVPWLGVLHELFPDMVEPAGHEAAVANGDEKSGIHEKPSVAKPRPRRPAKAARAVS